MSFIVCFLIDRPLLSEIQCLVNGRPEVSAASPSSRAAVPARRASDGFPLQRLQLICAVIEKRLQLPLWNKDVYLNVVGGLRVSEPSADLAVAMSIISSTLEEPIHHKTAFIGEIGERLERTFCSFSTAIPVDLEYSFFLLNTMPFQAWVASCAEENVLRSVSEKLKRWDFNESLFPKQVHLNFQQHRKRNPLVVTRFPTQKAA